jgi:hypothetical protein
MASQAVVGQEVEHKVIELIGLLHAYHVGDVVEDHFSSVRRFGSEQVGVFLSARGIEVSDHYENGYPKFGEPARSGRFHGARLAFAILAGVVAEDHVTHFAAHVGWSAIGRLAGAIHPES